MAATKSTASQNGSKSTPPPAPAAATPAPASENGKPAKAHSNSTRDNSFLKWKPSTLSRLQHVKERFPEVAKECDALIAKVMSLPDDYTANPENVKLAVGDTVRLPEHDSMLKSLKLENKGTIIELARGTAKVQVGPHSFTVVTRDVELIARKS